MEKKFYSKWNISGKGSTDFKWTRFSTTFGVYLTFISVLIHSVQLKQYSRAFSTRPEFTLRVFQIRQLLLLPLAADGGPPPAFSSWILLLGVSECASFRDPERRLDVLPWFSSHTGGHAGWGKRPFRFWQAGSAQSDLNVCTCQRHIWKLFLHHPNLFFFVRINCKVLSVGNLLHTHTHPHPHTQ